MDNGIAMQEGPKGRAMRELGVPVYKLSDYDAVDRFLTDKGIPYHTEEGANLSLLGRILLWTKGDNPLSSSWGGGGDARTGFDTC
jgi:hypothetical protein